MATLKQRISSFVDVLILKLNTLWSEIITPHENVVINITYSDLGLLEGSAITKEDMATYISNLGMDINRNTNYYFEVRPTELEAELLSFYISPITTLMYGDDGRTSHFPVYLSMNGEQRILDDNALFTPDEAGIRAFYNEYVALLNTVAGITATIDSSQDFSVGMEGDVLIGLEINSATFEGDFSIRYADSVDYENGNYAIIGFNYNALSASFYADFYTDSETLAIHSMKFFNQPTLEPFPAYGEAVDITLLQNE